MKSVKFLDEIAKANDLKNDNQISKFMGWQSGTITNYRAGRRVMDNEACLAVALKLGIDPLKVIMAADIDRAERAGQKSLWEVFSQRTSLAASVLAVVSVNLFLTPTPSEAAPVLKYAADKLCIMSNCC
ncbi:MAG TPA: hypothetical protein VJ577_05450 [Burkholderiaceae bacterium]|nr:hypothetical protein [Burkholderiaceae bacterium]